MSQLSHIPKIRLFLISELEPCNLFLYIPNSQTAHPEMLVYSANIAQRYRAMASMEQFLGSNSEQELLLTMQQTFCISPKLKGEIQNQKKEQLTCYDEQYSRCKSDVGFGSVFHASNSDTFQGKNCYKQTDCSQNNPYNHQCSDSLEHCCGREMENSY